MFCITTRALWLAISSGSHAEFDKKMTEQEKVDEALRKEARNFLLQNRSDNIPESDFDK